MSMNCPSPSDSDWAIKSATISFLDVVLELRAHAWSLASGCFQSLEFQVRLAGFDARSL